MANKVIKISDSEKFFLINQLKRYKKENNNPYIAFFGYMDDACISIYKTNKVVFAGSNIDKAIKEIETILNKSLFDTNDVEGIGSDEVGTGALFGPITVCATYVTKEDFAFLHELKIDDSKKMNDDEILRLGPILMEKIPYSLLILNNKKFNEMISRGYNMNKQKAILHNHAYSKLITRLGFRPNIYLDKFCSEENYYSYLQNEPVINRGIIMEEKGESKYIQIAAGSVIARYAYLKSMREMEEKLGFMPNFGAGDKADKDLAKLKSLVSKEEMANYVKLNFKNLEKIN